MNNKKRMQPYCLRKTNTNGRKEQKYNRVPIVLNLHD